MLSHPCDASEDPPTFPCGTVPLCASGAVSGSGCSNPALARRGTMYYYFNSAGPGYDVDGNGSVDALDQASLPIGASLMTSAGNGFTVDYGVGAVMCMIKKPSVAGEPTECTTDQTKVQGTYLFTVTAVGKIDGEFANTTLSTTFGTSPVAPGTGKAPTITASGTVDLNGNGTFVTNPDGGGSGLPVTVCWPQCVNTLGSGTVNSCYMEDWLRSSSGTYTYATNSDGTASTVPVCSGNGNNACSCSTSISAGPGSLTEGADILTNDTRGSCRRRAVPTGHQRCTANPTQCRANYNVDETEFPCDLFQYIFGTQAWEDDVSKAPARRTRLAPKAILLRRAAATVSAKAQVGLVHRRGWQFTDDRDRRGVPCTRMRPTSTDRPPHLGDRGPASDQLRHFDQQGSFGGLLWDQTGAS
jgi:hypothetical protein